MLLFLSISVVNKTLLDYSTYKRSCITNLLTINSNTKKLQKLLTDNTELVNVKRNNDFDNYFNSNKVIREILQKYWKEYIYIIPTNLAANSLEDIFLNSYPSQEMNLAVNQETDINLIKYLTNEQLKIYCLKDFDFLDKKVPIKYTNRKYINRLYRNLLKTYITWSQDQGLKHLYRRSLKNLEKQKFPVFIVANGINEIILGEPEYIPKTKQNLLERFSVLRKTVTKQCYRLPLREGYVFINPFDAIEYYTYLQSRYPQSCKELKVEIFVGTLKEYYQKSKFASTDVQFRLLPDLKELGKLITIYQYDSNIEFNTKQAYGKNYFQGQPIYFINPILCKYTNEQTGKVSERYFPNLLALEKKNYANVFTTRQDALSVWTKYRKNFNQYRLPKKPKLIIYNLESFLAEYEQQKHDVEDSNNLFRLVPSYDTYQYVKTIQTTANSPSSKYNSLSSQILLVIKIWVNRILWGMIKWHPPIQ